MARFWLLLVTAVASAGCLVEAPPTYQARLQTPPLLLLAQAQPSIAQVLQLDPDDANPSLQINVPVRSEDAGDDLLGILYLDYAAPGRTPERFTRTPASTFDDASRTVSLSWTYANVPGGCRSLTLLVTHESNFDVVTGAPKDDRDVALATWWANIDDDGTRPLADCRRGAP